MSEGILISGESIEEIEEIVEFEYVDYIRSNLLCADCSVEFETLNEWNEHTTRCHSENETPKNNVKKFHCTECDAVFTRKNNLLRHFRRFHEAVASPFRRLTYIPGHYYECSECETRFTRKSNLLRHIRRFHIQSIPVVCNPTPKLYECPDCGTRFTKWNNCKRHIEHFHSLIDNLQVKKKIMK